jgi:hypothetical protein
LDVIPLDICGIVWGSPYLYDKKAMFYREHNNGIEFIIRAHKMKHDLSVIATGQLKMLVNARKFLSLMFVKDCGLENALINTNNEQIFQGTEQVQHGALQHEGIIDNKSDTTEKDKLFMGSFYLASACSVLCLSLLLFSYVWIVASTLNADLFKDDRMIKFVNNMMVVFIFVALSQVILNGAGWIVDTGQLGIQCPHFILNKSNFWWSKSFPMGRNDLGGSMIAQK